MTIKHRITVASATLFLFATCTLAAPVPAPAKPPAPSYSQSEAELLSTRAQLVAVKEYHSSLLDTVYWALGTVTTVAALLAGFGWFANFKMYEADKSRLKEELETKLQAGASKLESRLSVHETHLLQQVDARLESSAARLLKDLDHLRTDLNLVETGAGERASEASASIGKLETRASDLTRTTKELEALIREVEEHIWNLKGIPINILITQSQALSAALSANSQQSVRSVLSRMKETIEKKISKGDHKLPKNMQSILLGELTEAAKIEPIQAEEVRTLVMNIPLRDSGDAA